MPSAVIVDVVRTPVGKRNGRLSGWHAVDLAAQPLRALVERNDLDPALGRGRDLRLHHDRRRAGHERRAQRRAGRRVPRHRPGHDRRPAVRLGPAGGPLRRPGGDVRRHGRGHRRRGGGDEPGAHRLDHRARPGRAPTGRPCTTGSTSSTRALSAEAIARRWGIGREAMDRFALALPPAGGPGHRRRSVRARDRAAGHPTGPGRGQGGGGRQRRGRSGRRGAARLRRGGPGRLDLREARLPPSRSSSRTA